MQYTITVADVVRANGLSCPPDKIKIVFEQPECADVICVQDSANIKISIPDGCDQKCFYGVASCDVECDTCGDMRIEICPCMDNTGCGPCSICDPIKHICISNCPPGQKCSEECGGCAECDSENPCTGDKVCQGCKCVCPPNKPYQGPNGNCIDCRDKTDCPPCHECTPEGCKPIVCTTGVCNNEKGCVECNSKTDCEGANKCCEDNKCVCCPGFVKDKDGNCIPAPDCKVDSDCGECQSCDIVNGKCKPTLCPPGTVCVGDGCLPICDCSIPLCDSNNACVRLDDSTCYCSSCNGSCADGKPCGPGCYCDKTDLKCKPNPCGGSCKNGTDCGPGCGCNPLTGECEPCGSVPCGNPCDTLLGCGCPDGTKCSDLADCGGDCTNGADCPPGCGCHEGKCVNCANFDCTECASVDGCKCVDTKCVTDPDRDCKDKAELIKDESNCSLTAKFDIKSPCSCPVITAGVIPTAFNMGISFKGDFKLQLRKGNVTNTSLFNNYPLLNDTTNISILDNDMPISGVITATAYAIYEDINTGKLLPRVQSGEESISVANKTEIEFKNLLLGTKPITGNILRKYEVEFKVTSKLSFENDCNYTVTDLFKISRNIGIVENQDILNKVYAVKGLTSGDTRRPEIVWYKSKTSTFTKENIFRKVYVGKASDGTYKDTLYGPGEIPENNPWPLNTPEGELWNGYNYKVSSSCSCDEASLDNLFFCNVNKFKYKFSNTGCQNTIQLLDPFTPCPINDILSKFNTPTYTVPSDTQTRFELFFNSKIAYSWIGALPQGFNIPFTETITSVTIVQFIGDKEVCRMHYTHPYSLPDPNFTYLCADGEDLSKVVVTLNQELGEPKISNVKFGVIENGNNTYPEYLEQYSHNGVFVNPLIVKIDKSLFGNNKLIMHVTFSNGCRKVVTMPDCNKNIVVTTVPDEYAYGECGGENPKIVVNTYGYNLSTLLFSLNGGPQQSSNEFLNVPAGNYNVQVTDGITSGNVIVVIKSPEQPNVYIVDSSICVGGATKLVINAPSGNTFSINTPTTTITATTVNGLYELNIPYSPSAIGNYTVTLISSPKGLCAFTKTMTLLSGGQSFNPTITFENATVCVGQEIKFRIDNGGSAFFNVSTNGTGIATPSVQAGTGFTGTFVPNGNIGEIQITGMSTGDNCNTTTQPIATVTVNSSPSILNANAQCNNDNTITVTVNTSNATLVKIANVNATEVAAGTWVRSGMTGITTPTILVEVYNGNCKVETDVTKPDCNCPSGTLYINSNGNLCGSGDAVFNYDNFDNQSPDSNWTYRWQTLNFGTYIDTTIETVFNIASLPVLNYSLTSGQSVNARLVLKNTINGCEYFSNGLEVMSYVQIPEPTITMTPNPTNVGTNTTFTANAGFATYQWKLNGVNVGSNQNTYQTSALTSPNVTIRVDVTNANGCTAFKEQIFNVGVNCPSITAVYQNSGTCSDIQFSINNSVGTIAWVATGTGSLGTVINQSGSTTGSTIMIDADILQPGESLTTLTFTFTYTQGVNPQCTVTSTPSFNYTRCANGCDCIYNISVVDSVSNVDNILSTFEVIELSGRQQIRHIGRKIVTKQCTGGVPQTLLDAIDNYSYGITKITYRVDLSIVDPVTSIDMIISGSPVTQAIPTSFGGGNPQMSATHLAQYLNNLTSTTIFTLVGNSVEFTVSNANTSGYNLSGTYTRGSGNLSFSGGASSTNYITQTYNTLCGNIVTDKLYDAPTSVSYTATYNSVTITGTPSVPFINNLGNHNPTRTCTGCN